MMSPGLNDAMLSTDTCWKKNHSIDWENASFVFNKKKVALRMVISSLMSKLPNFNLSSGFYSLPNIIAQDIVSELQI